MDRTAMRCIRRHSRADRPRRGGRFRRPDAVRRRNRHRTGPHAADRAAGLRRNADRHGREDRPLLRRGRLRRGRPTTSFRVLTNRAVAADKIDDAAAEEQLRSALAKRATSPEQTAAARAGGRAGPGDSCASRPPHGTVAPREAIPLGFRTNSIGPAANASLSELLQIANSHHRLWAAGRPTHGVRRAIGPAFRPIRRRPCNAPVRGNGPPRWPTLRKSFCNLHFY